MSSTSGKRKEQIALIAKTLAAGGDSDNALQALNALEVDDLAEILRALADARPDLSMLLFTRIMESGSASAESLRRRAARQWLSEMLRADGLSMLARTSRARQVQPGKTGD